MKIGISDSKKWGDSHYLKLKSFGFDCYDFNMADTNTLPYINVGKGFEKHLENEKSNAKAHHNPA